MNKEFLFPINKHTDAPIEQTKSKPQETLEYKLHKQLEIFFFAASINFFEEEGWLLAVTSIEATRFVFKLKKTTVFELLHQVIGLPVMKKKLTIV